MRATERWIILAAFVCASASCESTQPVPPEQLSAAVLRSDILGHWYKETFKDTPDYRFEVQYRPDGSVFARQWDSAEYPDGKPKVWHHDYSGTWRLDGATIAHHWTGGLSSHDSGPDLRECRIHTISPKYMDLRDTVMGYILTFHRKPTISQ